MQYAINGSRQHWDSSALHHSTGIPVAQHVQKHYGLGNARRGPRCAGTATNFDSYQILYIKQMVEAVYACANMEFFLSFDVDQANGKLGYMFFLISSAARFMSNDGRIVE